MLRIMPRQRVYFDCFEQCVRAGADAAGALREMLEKPAEFERFVERIEQLEQQGDKATAMVVETLAKGLATPFSGAEIRQLIDALDDALDGLETVAHKLVIYRATRVRPEARELADVLVAMGPVVEKVLVGLRSSRDAEGVLAPCREVHRLEAEGDKVLRRALGALFDELKDPIELIKWKEILELLETCTDRFEDAIRVVEEVVRKHG